MLYALKIIQKILLLNLGKNVKSIYIGYPAIYNRFNSRQKAINWLSSFSAEDISLMINQLNTHSLRQKLTDTNLSSYIQKGTLHLIEDIQKEIKS